MNSQSRKPGFTPMWPLRQGSTLNCGHPSCRLPDSLRRGMKVDPEEVGMCFTLFRLLLAKYPEFQGLINDRNLFLTVLES